VRCMPVFLGASCMLMAVITCNTVVWTQFAPKKLLPAAGLLIHALGHLPDVSIGT
jgi:hypothetical protein